MSQVQQDVDLSALARPAEAITPPRRGWLRILLPLAILGAFGFVLRDTLVELLRSRPKVSLERPVRLEGPSTNGGGQRSLETPNSVVVQAAGWVEPDPFPIHAPALSGGVVAEILVQEADVVSAGDPVARLVADDARLARDGAAADLARAEGVLRVAKVRASISAERYDAALEVTEAAESAEAIRATLAAHVEHREAAVAEGVARVELAESEIVVQRELEAAGASGARQVEIAEAELEIARAQLALLRAELESARGETAAAAAVATRAERELELRFEDRLERDVTAAEVVRAEGELARARANLGEADLRLDRVTVVAPCDGVVLERLATPGDTLAPGAPVFSLYDPAHLRVRVDVPQGDVEKLFVGQAAEVLADSRGGRPYRGQVLRIVERADIQKVTLEAQVRILESDALLKPDGLTQVRFFDVATDENVESTGEGSQPRIASAARLRIAVLSRLVEDSAVWVLDPTAGVARRREIELGAEVPDGRGLVEVLDGLNLTDKIIADGRALLARSGETAVSVEVRESSTSQNAQGGSTQ